MPSIDSDELALIRSSLRHVLASTPDAGVPGGLLEEGWQELVDADPAAAITTLAEEAGRARSGAPVTDLAVMWGAGIEADPGTAVVLDGLVLAGAERAERFLWLEPERLVLIPPDRVSLAPIRGFDPALGLSAASIVGDDTAGELVGGAGVAERALAAGRRSLSSQMVGAVEQMLTDTLAYVVERHQYGRPIGSFQTVKHRLADVKVAASAARAAVTAAWEDAESEDGPILSIAAKCLAGRAQQVASTHCFQVHGGIAFTVEHGFQQWVRRGMLLDLLLGGHVRLTSDLGRRLIDRGVVPRAPALRIA